jgi:hypothetical protein
MSVPTATSSPGPRTPWYKRPLYLALLIVAVIVALVGGTLGIYYGFVAKKADDKDDGKKPDDKPDNKPDALTKKVDAFKNAYGKLYAQDKQLDLLQDEAGLQQTLTAFKDFDADAAAKAKLGLTGEPKKRYDLILKMAQEHTAADLRTVWEITTKDVTPTQRKMIKDHKQVIKGSDTWLTDHQVPGAPVYPPGLEKFCEFVMSTDCKAADNCPLPTEEAEELRECTLDRADLGKLFAADPAKQAIAESLYDGLRLILVNVRDNGGKSAEDARLVLLLDATDNITLRHEAVDHFKASLTKPGTPPPSFGNTDWQATPFDITIKAHRDLVVAVVDTTPAAVVVHANCAALKQHVAILKAAAQAANTIENRAPGVKIALADQQAVQALIDLAAVDTFVNKVAARAFLADELAKDVPATVSKTAEQQQFDAWLAKVKANFINEISTTPDDDKCRGFKDAMIDEFLANKKLMKDSAWSKLPFNLLTNTSSQADKDNFWDALKKELKAEETKKQYEELKVTLVAKPDAERQQAVTDAIDNMNTSIKFLIGFKEAKSIISSYAVKELLDKVNAIKDDATATEAANFVNQVAKFASEKIGQYASALVKLITALGQYKTTNPTAAFDSFAENAVKANDLPAFKAYTTAYAQDSALNKLLGDDNTKAQIDAFLAAKGPADYTQLEAAFTKYKKVDAAADHFKKNVTVGRRMPKLMLNVNSAGKVTEQNMPLPTDATIVPEWNECIVAVKDVLPTKKDGVVAELNNERDGALGKLVQDALVELTKAEATISDNLEADAIRVA